MPELTIRSSACCCGRWLRTNISYLWLLLLLFSWQTFSYRSYRMICSSLLWLLANVLAKCLFVANRQLQEPSVRSRTISSHRPSVLTVAHRPALPPCKDRKDRGRCRIWTKKKLRLIGTQRSDRRGGGTGSERHTTMATRSTAARAVPLCLWLALGVATLTLPQVCLHPHLFAYASHCHCSSLALLSWDPSIYAIHPIAVASACHWHCSSFMHWLFTGTCSRGRCGPYQDHQQGLLRYPDRRQARRFVCARKCVAALLRLRFASPSCIISRACWFLNLLML